MKKKIFLHLIFNQKILRYRTQIKWTKIDFQWYLTLNTRREKKSIIHKRLNRTIFLSLVCFISPFSVHKCHKSSLSWPLYITDHLIQKQNFLNLFFTTGNHKFLSFWYYFVHGSLVNIFIFLLSVSNSLMVFIQKKQTIL